MQTLYDRLPKVSSWHEGWAGVQGHRTPRGWRHMAPNHLAGQEAGLAALSLAVHSGLLTRCVKQSLSRPWVLVLLRHSTDN